MLALCGVVAAAAMVGASVTIAATLNGGFDRTAQRAGLPDVLATFSPSRVRGSLRSSRGSRTFRAPGMSCSRSAWRCTPPPRHGGTGDAVNHGKLFGVSPGRHGYVLVAGHDIHGLGEAVVEAGFAQSWQLHVGDRIGVQNGYGRGESLRIVGIALPPDTVAFPLTNGPRIYTDYEDARRIDGVAPGVVNGVDLWLADPRLVDVTLAQARSASFGVAGLQLVTRTGLKLLIGQAAGIVIAVVVGFSLIALLVACVMLSASAAAEVQRRLPAVGLLRSVGVSARTLVAAAAVEATAFTLPAAAIGVLGGWLAVQGPANRLLASLNEVPPGVSLALLLVASIVGFDAASWWPQRAGPRGGRRDGHRSRCCAGATSDTAHATCSASGFSFLGVRLVLARPARAAATVAVVGFAVSVVLTILAIATVLQNLNEQPLSIGKRYQLLVYAQPSQLRQSNSCRELRRRRRIGVSRLLTRSRSTNRSRSTFSARLHSSTRRRRSSPATSRGTRTRRRSGRAWHRRSACIRAARLPSSFRPGKRCGSRSPGSCRRSKIGTDRVRREPEPARTRPQRQGRSHRPECFARLDISRSDRSGRSDGFNSSTGSVGPTGQSPPRGPIVIGGLGIGGFGGFGYGGQIAVKLEPGASSAAVTELLSRHGHASTSSGGIAGQSVQGWASRSSGFIDILVALLRTVAILDVAVCLYAVGQALALTSQERRRTLAVVRAQGAGRLHLFMVFGVAAAFLVFLAWILAAVLERWAVEPGVSRLAASYVVLALSAGDQLLLLTLGGLLLGAAIVSALLVRAIARQPVVAGLRGLAEVQVRVAVGRLAGEILWAPALEVEVGELHRDRGKVVARVGVEHPGLQDETAVGRPLETERARLLGVVDEGRGRDHPVATARCAPRRDHGAVRSAADCGNDVRVAVEQSQRSVAADGTRQRAVGEEDDAPAAGRLQLLAEPPHLSNRAARLPRCRSG